jgi:predicted nucleic acid-binding protein
MPSPPLADTVAPLVIDTSVVLNLIASNFAVEILNVIPNPVVISSSVLSEIDLNNRRLPNAGTILSGLMQDRIRVIELSPEAERNFESLISGGANETLDDGEAATIASTVELAGISVIDESKATRIIAERFPTLRVVRTTDLFMHRNVFEAIGLARLSEAVFNALQLARMQVVHEHAQWVVGLLGTDRARQCTSLRNSVRRDLR